MSIAKLQLDSQMQGVSYIIWIDSAKVYCLFIQKRGRSHLRVTEQRIFKFASITVQGAMSSDYYKEEQNRDTLYKCTCIDTYSDTHPEVSKKSAINKFYYRHAQGNKSQEKKQTDVLL